MMKTFARPRLLVLALYIASAALVTVRQAILRHSNNVSIFRSASFNLFAGRDLYAAHPEQHFDFYKYSPTFAVLFAPLAYLPFALTFLCWTLLNGLLLWYALDRLLPERGRPSRSRSCTSRCSWHCSTARATRSWPR